VFVKIFVTESERTGPEDCICNVSIFPVKAALK
jgi:hypothetical protein